jgi:DNA-directed RNA polymerase subunit RPC12/RpoP
MIIHCSYKQLIKLCDLIPHPRNTNKHSQKQIELLAKLIKYQGIRHPIIVSNFSGRIVAGHARLEAAKLLGYKEFPVDYQDFESEAQEYAFLESDNKVAELAEWDREKFDLNIDELKLDLDFDHELFGVLNSDVKIEEHEIDEDDDGYSSKNKEIDVDDLTKDLKNKCPKCGFMYNE